MWLALTPDLSSTFIDDFDRGKTLGGVIREHCFAWKAAVRREILRGRCRRRTSQPSSAATRRSTGATIGAHGARYEIATPDVEWGATGAFPGVEGVYRGPEAMQRWIDVIRSEWKDFEVALDEVLYDRGTCSQSPSGSEAEDVKAVQRSRCASSRPTGSSKGSSGGELPSPNGRQPSKPPGFRSRRAALDEKRLSLCMESGN